MISAKVVESRTTQLILLLADGLGGHNGGAVASRHVVASLSSALCGASPQLNLGKILQQTNESFSELVRGTDDTKGPPMGTTVAGLIVNRRGIVSFNIGDSRIYEVGPPLRLLSIDDRVVGRTNRLTQCLGGVFPIEPITPHIIITDLRPCKLLLFTDGVTDVISDEIIESIAINSAPKEAINDLFEIVFDAGAPDNLTAIVAELDIE